MGRDVFDGMTRLKQLHILKAIFKCVLFLHNKTPKVFCLTFGVHVKPVIPFLFREAGREPLGDGGAGEGVGDAEVEVLLEVREGGRMEPAAWEGTTATRFALA